MKKTILLVVTFVFMMALAGCQEKSAMQEATGADAKQARAIDETIEAAGISYEMINEANHNKPDAEIPEGTKVYNLIDKDANNYFMVLDGEFKVVMLMDSEGNIL